ncbi:MAG: hypothetical protein J1G06_04485 [Oscillospiraceae bacterium]|nr:hypothetical protein [Oscillospiraceae bacterium]
MDDKTIELINTGMVKPEYVKNVTHFFCGAVMAENDKQRNVRMDDLREAVNMVGHNIIHFSNAWAEKIGIRTVTWEDKLLEIFFNQKNMIPAYIEYWLIRYYNSLLEDVGGNIANYSDRHYNIYDKLQRMYVEHYRWIKQDAKEVKKMKGDSGGSYASYFAVVNMPKLSRSMAKIFQSL